MSLRLKEFTKEKHKDHCLIYPCKCKTHKYFCTKKQIDSFINLSSDNLNFILSKYTNHPNKHNNLSRMCIFALNIKCCRSLGGYNTYCDLDKNEIDQTIDFNYYWYGNHKDSYKTDQEINKIFGFNKYKNGIRKFIYNRQKVY
tara:strand:- start:360 stop:788 length:429 start_codon:yes stop_codon:yes gene_type:complete